jgi:hypothetical protein
LVVLTFVKVTGLVLHCSKVWSDGASLDSLVDKRSRHFGFGFANVRESEQELPDRARHIRQPMIRVFFVEHHGHDHQKMKENKSEARKHNRPQPAMPTRKN